ncbi:uncharacterized protein F5147DRAFT_714283 [Suillus discolor]|uniref:Uncharacterized protein n=1 Tax=Suillus discolor TaxID=1912936 RepID=A0A9P7EYE7_9AGAM|nr:uncharacterized protein F5147DRAFT_714283 [Suillus discolor]KAG2098255.1 hypothetical protein F5147DRAFT_714283 [Suillus discolor]
MTTAEFFVLECEAIEVIHGLIELIRFSCVLVTYLWSTHQQRPVIFTWLLANILFLICVWVNSSMFIL